jgi:hypothetical protein
MTKGVAASHGGIASIDPLILRQGGNQKQNLTNHVTNPLELPTNEYVELST